MEMHGKRDGEFDDVEVVFSESIATLLEAWISVRSTDPVFESGKAQIGE